MIDLESLYSDWLLTCLDPDGVPEEVAYVSGLLHAFPFLRRVGNDVNRAVDGVNLRMEFMSQFEDANLDPHVTDDLMDATCTWLEMLVALSRALDYTYDGGVEYRFIELICNLGLDPLLEPNPRRSRTVRDYDRHVVESAVHAVNNSTFDRDGQGGLFPLFKLDHPDQRGVEIWDQHAAYFRERLEGVLWTSTS